MRLERLQQVRLVYGVLTSLYIWLIAAASFYLTGDIPKPAQALDLLLITGSAFKVSFHNLRDVATNILLYMPLGVLIALYRQTYEIKRFFWFAGLGFVLSLGVEIIQSFIGRYSDISDIVSNSTGYMFGYITALISVRLYHIDPGSLVGIPIELHSSAESTVVGLRFAFLVICYVVTLLPFDFSVSLTDIHAKLLPASDLMPPRIILDPLFHYEGEIDLQYLILNGLMYFPLAFLSAYLLVLRQKLSVLLPALHCLFFGLVVEFSNVFVLSGRSDIILPVLGFLIGLATAILVNRFYLATTFFANNDNADQTLIWVLLLLGYGLFLLFLDLSPFEFEQSLKEIKSKAIHHTNVVPFGLHFSNRSVAAGLDIVKEVVKYMPFGAIIALVQIQRKGGYSSLVIGLIGLLYAVTLELLQLFAIGRYVDVTDSLLGVFGCVLGARLIPALKQSGLRINR